MLELTYCDLRCKEIVNAIDGKRLGRILDMVFTPRGEILGIVAPYGRKGLFFKSQEIFIPWRCIKKIGEDIILVELLDTFAHGHKDRRHKDKPHFDGGEGKHGGHYMYDCDYDDFGHEHDGHHDGHHDGKRCDDCDDGHGKHHEHREFEECRHEHEREREHRERDECRHEHEREREHREFEECRHEHEREREHREREECRHEHEEHRDCKGHGMPNCDRRCEKCMLFDCIHRWREAEGIFVDNKKYK